MKIIYNSIIPFNGYKYINLFGIIFTKSKTFSKIENWPINDYIHEYIHTLQWKECLWIFYPIIYFIGFIYGGFSYRKNPLEKEAYNNENNENYLKERKLFNWIKYL